MAQLTLPKATDKMMKAKPVAGNWRYRETQDGNTLELFRFGGSWSPPSPEVKLHPGPPILLLDAGEVFVPESR